MKYYLLVLLLGLSLLISCDENTTEYKDFIDVDAGILKMTDRITATIRGVPSVPRLYLDGVEYPLTMEYDCYTINGTYHPDSSLSEVNMRIEFTRQDGGTGAVWSTVKKPGAGELINIADSDCDTLIVEEDFTYHWHPSSDADWYNAYLYLTYACQIYPDIVIIYEFRVDTTITDTCLTIPASEISPYQDYISIGSSHGYFILSPIAGSVSEYDSGNIEGDGTGYFFVTGEPHYRNLKAAME